MNWCLMEEKCLKSLVVLNILSAISFCPMTCRIFDFVAPLLSLSFVSSNTPPSVSLLILEGWFHISTPSVSHKNRKTLFNLLDRLEVCVWALWYPFFLTTFTNYQQMFFNQTSLCFCFLNKPNAVTLPQRTNCSHGVCQLLCQAPLPHCGEHKCPTIGLLESHPHNCNLWITVASSCPSRRCWVQGIRALAAHFWLETICFTICAHYNATPSPPNAYPNLRHYLTMAICPHLFVFAPSLSVYA